MEKDESTVTVNSKPSVLTELKESMLIAVVVGLLVYLVLFLTNTHDPTPTVVDKTTTIHECRCVLPIPNFYIEEEAN